jgi:D-lyxose ketol-isomerase
MRTLAAALALGVAFSVAPFVQSAQAGQTHVQQVQAKKHVVKGTFSSMDGDTLVVSVTNKQGDKKDRKIKTDSNTKVTLDGKDAKLTDLKAGQELKITPGAAKGDPASEIEATSASEAK